MEVSKLPGDLRSYDTEQVKGRGKADLDQQDFLELMTAQLKTQDPFQPQDASKMMEQITQFGMVESIQDMNKQFSRVAAKMTSSEVLQSVSLLDRNVLVDSQQGYLEGEDGLEGMMELDSSSIGLTLSIADARGQLVRQIDLGPQPPGELEFTWDGRMDDGKMAPVGVYSVQAISKNADGSQAAHVWMAGRVSSVTPGDEENATMLELKGLGRVSLDDIKKVQ